MRGRAFRRAQRDRARARSRELVHNIFRVGGDGGYSAYCERIGVAEADWFRKLERMYAVDRAPHNPMRWRGEHRQEIQAAVDEQQQTAELGG